MNARLARAHFLLYQFMGHWSFFLIVLVEPLVPLVFRIHQEPLLYSLPERFNSFRQERIARRATTTTAYVCVVTRLRVEATNYRLLCCRIGQQLVA